MYQCTLTVRENVLGGDSLLINDTREYLHEALVAPGQAEETARLQAAYEQEGGMSAAENETLEE